MFSQPQNIPSLFEPFFIMFNSSNSEPTQQQVTQQSFSSQQDAIRQANEILRKVDSLYKKGYSQVGITYSANNDQTVQINKTYNNGQWLTGTTGSNQAEVMAEVEKLLASKQFQHLKNVFRILPITTCAHAGGAGAVDNNRLKKDLKNIDDFLQNGNHVVLGWQNQNTINTNAPFAIGGGISAQLTQAQNNFIQSELVRFQIKFSPSIRHSASQMIQSPSQQQPVSQGIRALSQQQSAPAPEIIEASRSVGSQISKQIKTNNVPLIRKGNIKDTFKVAFKSQEEATAFYNHLQAEAKKLNFELKNITFHNKEKGKEIYPMDANGNVVAGGEYSNIVRFEIPEDASKYLQHIMPNNSDEVFNTIMERPSSSPSFRRR